MNEVLYKNELREPNYTEVMNDMSSPKGKLNACQNFRRSYIANGQQVQLKSLHD